jgi:hypothetical protein
VFTPAVPLAGQYIKQVRGAFLGLGKKYGAFFERERGERGVRRMVCVIKNV